MKEMNKVPGSFTRFLDKKIDLRPVGVEITGDAVPYFCTPQGAVIFGRTGVDGIHFCFIPGLGETVFAVSPMNDAPDRIHPLAETFTDFLRLLLACGDVAALEQAWMWNKGQFEAFLRDNPVTEEQRHTLDAIARGMNLTPAEQPWEYMRALQSDFDYRNIRHAAHCGEPAELPAGRGDASGWAVFFDGGFRARRGSRRAGQEIPLETVFEWAGHRWAVPAVYVCDEGLVADLCMGVDADEIRAFMEKWNLNPENDSCTNFTPEQQLELERENPLMLDFTPCMECNGKEMSALHASSLRFIPFLPDACDLRTRQVVEHYGLDPSCGWVIWREAFPWRTARRPELRTLTLSMKQRPVRIPGPRFRVHAPGDSAVLSHPVSGEEYTLTVRKVEHQTVLAEHQDRGHRIPVHLVMMRYSLSPEPEVYPVICDCYEGDRPGIAVLPGAAAATDGVSGATGVIGGADGPTVLLLHPGADIRVACSALYDEPVQHDLEWRADFYGEKADDFTAVLI